MLMSEVEKWKSGKPQTFFEKIWENPCTIQKKSRTFASKMQKGR
jgi:hypothetical protein